MSDTTRPNLLVRQPYLTARWPKSEEAAPLCRFLGLTAGVVIVGTITGRTDLLFLATRQDLATVGRYAGAMQLASLSTLLAGYASIALQPTLIASVPRGQPPKLLFQNIAFAAVLGTLIVAISWTFGGPLVAAVFGESYVIERWKLSAGGNTVDVSIDVDDPGVFTMPWRAAQRWRRVQLPLEEVICAENNSQDFIGFKVPIPQASKPDF